MVRRSRRGFVADVGKGMLISSLGSVLATDLGLVSAQAAASDDTGRLDFGPLEQLVGLMQDVELDQLQPALVNQISSGVSLKTLVAAGALANARSFGGQDYIGYHSLMAMLPALQMARQLPAEMKPLPVLKVLYRSAKQIREAGGSAAERLHPIEAVASDGDSQTRLMNAVHAADLTAAEQAFAALRNGSATDMFAQVLPTVHEHPDVHRVVLAWRSFALVDIAGQENALTLLRQSIRYAVDGENYRHIHNQPEPEIRSVLPGLLDQYQLVGKDLGSRSGDDTWLDELGHTILVSSRAAAAEAVAQAIAEGYSAKAISEAISVAANLLLLQDPGRSKYTNELKPAGSVHGDSVGVHASDAANAWRHIASVGSSHNRIASLIVAAYHTAGQYGYVQAHPWPLQEHQALVKGTGFQELLSEMDDAVRAGDQARSCAVVSRIAEAHGDAEPVFARLLQYATTEDGALHAEKYYQTAYEEFRLIRNSRRWRQVIALARVTASEYGRRADGIEQAQELLGLS